MNYKQLLEAALKRAKELSTAANERELTDEEMTEVKSLTDEIGDLRAKVKAFDDGQALLKGLSDLGADADRGGAPSGDPDSDVDAPASPGAHFVKSAAYKRAVESKGGRFAVSAPEFVPPAKAAGDPTLSTGNGQVQYGGVVPLPLARPTVTSLLSQGTLSGTSLTYFVQSAMVGGFAQVAENAQKPGMTFDADPVTATLHKIAGWYKISDEAIEDTPYVKTVIDNQLLVRLALAEEQAVLNGSGSGGTMTGILQTSGIQTEVVNTDTDADDNILRALFRAITKVQTGALVTADGIVIHPTDYQTARMLLDANKQFYGGGPFTGAYGNTGLPTQPDIWGYRTVVTTAIAQGTALVGNFQTGAQLFRKGGVRVDSTNSDGTDFQFNRIMVRAEVRDLLAVYQPLAFTKVTFADAGA